MEIPQIEAATEDRDPSASLHRPPTATATDIMRIISAEDTKYFADHGVVLETQRKIRKRLEKMTERAFVAYKFTLLVSKCLRNMDIETGLCDLIKIASPHLDFIQQLSFDTAAREYATAKSNEVQISSDSLFNLLSLFAGLGEQGSSSGPVRVIEPPSNFEMAKQV